MATYAFKARDRKGLLHSGKIDAASEALARAKLQRRQWQVNSLKALAGDGSDADAEITPILGTWVYRDHKDSIQLAIGGLPKPSSKDRIVFTKQFATMINSGIPLIQALQILAGQQATASFRQCLKKVEKAIANGLSISQALAQHPDVFDNLYQAMTAAGEVSGKLDTILSKLVTFMEKSEKIKSQVKSAMSYPVIILVVAITVVAGLLTFVVPTFAQQFAETGRTLPGLTQFVIDASEHLQNNILLYIGAMAAFVVGFRYWLTTPKGRMTFDRYILHAPVLGQLLQKVAIGRFCSTLGIMLSSGVNLLTALTICASSSGNTTIEAFVHGVRSSLEKGSTLSAPLGQSWLFPQMVVSMIAVGESTGNLDEMLNKVSDYYDEEVDVAVKGLLAMIEPIMIVFIGGVVGFIVIAMYLPIFEMAG
jgi:type IV pilus assembly protein PilC